MTVNDNENDILDHNENNIPDSTADRVIRPDPSSARMAEELLRAMEPTEAAAVMARPKPTATNHSARYFFWGKVLMGVALAITVINLIALQQETAPQTVSVLGNEVMVPTIEYIEALADGGKLVLTLHNLTLLTFIAATGLFALGLRELLHQVVTALGSSATPPKAR